MNKETQQLLEKLAEKLGTTVSYLWQVLIKQAQVDAFTTLFQFALIGLFGWLLYRLHKKFLFVDENDRYSRNIYSRYEELVAIPMVVGMCIFIVLTLFAFIGIPDLINGFFNPEYWALQRILNATTGK